MGDYPGGQGKVEGQSTRTVGEVLSLADTSSPSPLVPLLAAAGFLLRRRRQFEAGEEPTPRCGLGTTTGAVG